ncbi:MAG TPA: hypothetical protein VFQ14_00575 [Thermoleophilaceae bacterium]|nr:hypothetical protein [Thermoleophilaceae bacterium]
MKRIAALRPSPALVIACIALFVALGGVSYGLATGSIDSREIADNTIRSKDVRDNSVYSRDLRNNDVRDIDIRNGTIKGRDVAKATLTGDNVNMAKLGQVPDAAALGGVAAKDYALAAEPVRLVGTTGETPFSAGFSANGGADLAPGFWKAAGMVWLQGTVTGGPGIAFTLPTGYRPAGDAHFVGIDVQADGDVDVPAGAVSLDGVSFRAD